jgi:hypothetical protein
MSYVAVLQDVVRLDPKMVFLSEKSDAYYAVQSRGLIQVPFQIFFGRFVAYVFSDDDAAQLMPRSAPELGHYLFVSYVVFLYDFHFVPFKPGVWAVDFYHQADHCSSASPRLQG